jgi:hypothetical protein
MLNRYPLALFTVVLAVLACGLPSPAAPPTAFPEPATPAFLPLPVATSPAPAATSAPAAAAFTGTWAGPDPDDGSTMRLVLAQIGSSLTGTYSDSYSGSISPPGFDGTVSGTVLSPTTAQLTLDVKRHDGASLNLQASLSLSASGDVLTVTITNANTSAWALRRQ